MGEAIVAGEDYEIPESVGTTPVYIEVDTKLLEIQRTHDNRLRITVFQGGLEDEIVGSILV